MAKATVFHLDTEYPNVRKLKKVIDAFNNGDVVIYPTDTVYGMGCIVTKKRSIEKVYSIKNLKQNHLMSFICSDVSQASKYVNIDNKVFAILKRILPGPYTIILEASRDVPKVVLGKRRTVGIRVPASPVARYLVDNLEYPIVSTSVTDADGEVILDPEKIYNQYGSHVPVIIDKGFIGDELSTVLSYVDGEWELIRQGKGPVDFLD